MIGSVTLRSIAYFTSTENIKVPHSWLFVLRIHEWSVDNGLVILKAFPCHYIAIRTRCTIYTLDTNFRPGCSDTNVDTIYITCDLFCAIKRACFSVALGISYYTCLRCLPMTYCRNICPFMLNRYDTEFILKNIRASFPNTKMHQDIWGRLSIKYRLTSKEHTILYSTQESQTWKTAFPSV